MRAHFSVSLAIHPGAFRLRYFWASTLAGLKSKTLKVRLWLTDIRPACDLGCRFDIANDFVVLNWLDLVGLIRIAPKFEVQTTYLCLLRFLFKQFCQQTSPDYPFGVGTAALATRKHCCLSSDSIKRFSQIVFQKVQTLNFSDNRSLESLKFKWSSHSEEL